MEARVAFSDAWEALVAEREEIQTQLDEIEEQLKCWLTPGQKDCLDKAAEDVFEDVARSIAHAAPGSAPFPDVLVLVGERGRT